MDIQLEGDHEEGRPQKKLKIVSDGKSSIITEPANLNISDTDLGDNKDSQSTEEYIPFEKETEDRDEEGEMASVGGMIWRLRVNNLPKFMDAKTLKKSLEKWGVTDSKPKKGPKWDYAFLTFKTEAALQEATLKIDGQIIKNKKLKTEINNTTQDAHRNRFAQKAVETQEKITLDPRTPAEKLADQVTPYHSLSYDNQLEKKKKEITSILSNYRNQMKKMVQQQETPERVEMAKVLLEWALDKSPYGFNLPCPMLDIIASPLTEGYRTKCEFSIGTDLDGQPSVGFLLGLYKDGITAVLSPQDCLHVGEKAKRIAGAMQDYIRKSDLETYDRTTKQGHWRSLLVRTQRCGEIMVVVQFHPQHMTPERVIEEKVRLKEYWESLKIAEDGLDITTLLVQLYDGVSNGFQEHVPMEVIFGPGYVHEELLGCRFRISPTAFFQVNTPATELLYSIVRDWCAIDSTKPPTLLDLCCGTGTIGITMAKSVNRVVGIEMVGQAIEDAKENAERNDIKNVEYICSKVEDALYVFNGLSQTDNVVAVLDPPRNGVHQSVIKSVRRSDAIKRLIFIACDAQQATQNFVNLTRPPSNAWIGQPFVPKRCVAVDLFPHTKHCELIVEFERA